MSKLTLDEAIKHCLEVVENNEQFASGKWIGSEGEANRQECEQCAADHRQLAEWLMELKDLKAEQNDQYVFIHELMSDLKEAKRLLKVAVDDLNFESQCRNCKHKKYGLNTVCKECRGNKYKWRYADEAEKLIES